MGAPIVRAPGLSFLENKNPIGNLSQKTQDFHFISFRYTTLHSMKNLSQSKSL